MSGNVLQKINFLIDQHVETPYKECPGCKYCKEIERISMESGLWLGGQQKPKIGEGKRRAKQFTKEDLKKYLDAGVPIYEICRRENFAYNTVDRRIKKWFPEYVEKKKRDLMPLERYISFKSKGLTDLEIAESENVSYSQLRYQVKKWKKAGKLTGKAI